MPGQLVALEEQEVREILQWVELEAQQTVVTLLTGLNSVVAWVLVAEVVAEKVETQGLMGVPVGLLDFTVVAAARAAAAVE